VPDKYLGLDRFVVREMIVADMKAAGHLIPHVTKDKDGEEVTADFEPRTIQTPFGDRGGVVIEPWLTDQWYVDAEELAKPPMEAVRSGRSRSCPRAGKRPSSTGWRTSSRGASRASCGGGTGFRLGMPEDGEIFVAETEEARRLWPGTAKITRDNDVLDTWFSSALWPFATLGWPDETGTGSSATTPTTC
jgi:valyl-tRNA synthetase